MSKEELVAFLNDVVDALTWKRFFLLALLGVFLVGLAVIFESRSILLNKLLSSTSVSELPLPWEVSTETKTQLTEVTKNPLVGAVMLSEVNLKKNHRVTKFWYVRDADLRQAAAQVVTNMIPQPFFDSSKNNNEQMLGVLNNQFVCTPSSETIFERFFEGIDKRFPTVCRLAVPPFAGEFAGIITILLVKTPTDTEIESLKIRLSQISIELYLRDINKRGRR